jgi:hypothetical protein
MHDPADRRARFFLRPTGETKIALTDFGFGVALFCIKWRAARYPTSNDSTSRCNKRRFNKYCVDALLATG